MGSPGSFFGCSASGDDPISVNVRSNLAAIAFEVQKENTKGTYDYAVNLCGTYLAPLEIFEMVFFYVRCDVPRCRKSVFLQTQRLGLGRVSGFVDFD